LAALSLANLLLVRIWVELLGEHAEPAPAVWYGAALVTMSVLAIIIRVGARRGGFPGRLMLAAASTTLLAKEFTLAAGHEGAPWKNKAAAVVENGLRTGWLWAAGGCFLILLGWVAWRTQLNWVPSGLMMLSPILIVTAGQVAWRLAQPSPAAAQVHPAASRRAVPIQAKTRVVWIVFDELDERIAFSQRPPGLRLPALDTMRAESVVFRQAFSPSNSTAISIPALLGHTFERPGLESGVAGWFIPYCHNYGKLLAACRSWEMNRQLNSYGAGFANVVRNQLRSLLESSLYSPFGQSLAVEAHVRTVLEMESSAAQLAAQPNLHFVFLHLPMPHSPYVYRPAKRDLGARNQGFGGYTANLELADRAFARIRSSITASGLWSRTHVIITGDHGFRYATHLGYPSEDRHVPFIWKPAGEVAPRQLEQHFETIRTSGLVSRLLDGETAESVLAGYP
jgi:hypothetical protein